MAKLSTCATCGGFLPRSASSCPHCRTLVRAAKIVGGVIGGGVIAFTLMACYGRPPCKDGTQNCYRGAPGDDGSTPTAPSSSSTPASSGTSR